MVPELIKTDDEGKSGLSTNSSDAFALGDHAISIGSRNEEKSSAGGDARRGLERATTDMAMVKGLTEFDAN
jgi:hypothetical protein